MQIVRSAGWIAMTAILVAFIAINWETAPVNIWPLESGYLHFEWPVGFIALFFLALGFAPMWLVHKGARWRLQRRIAALENSVRAATPPPPIATYTQLAAEAEKEESQSG